MGVTSPTRSFPGSRPRYTTVKAVFKTGGERRLPQEFVVEYQTGERIFTEGDLGTEMYIILDGQVDIVFSCENAKGKSGVMWLTSPDWTPREISGKDEGVKFDRIELLDLDADGDLDLLTCEERDNLGVIWYENPQR